MFLSKEAKKIVFSDLFKRNAELLKQFILPNAGREVGAP